MAAIEPRLIAHIFFRFRTPSLIPKIWARRSILETMFTRRDILVQSTTRKNQHQLSSHFLRNTVLSAVCKQFSRPLPIQLTVYVSSIQKDLENIPNILILYCISAIKYFMLKKMLLHLHICCMTQVIYHHKLNEWVLYNLALKRVFSTKSSFQPVVEFIISM